MRIQFRRKISSGTFIPEIDGLRFIAILSVVAYHINIFLSVKDENIYEETYSTRLWDSILAQGRYGVLLFFVISGFILARPFAQMHIHKGQKVKLKRYFVRRLTRLEPPYLLVLIILLFASVYVAKILPFQEAFWSFLASASYMHNIIYGQFPLLLGVAWSLEIEVQFYLLMPLLARVFMMNNALMRRSLLVLTSIGFLVFDFFETLPFRSILNYMEFFLAGLLLADLYVSKSILLKKLRVKDLFSVLMIVLILLLGLIQSSFTGTKIAIELIQLFACFMFCYFVLFHRAMKWLSKSIITNIGGMCYSIYLLHYSIISAVGNPLVKWTFSSDMLISRGLYFLILLALVLSISSIYFLMIERPCMDKFWYKKLGKWIILKIGLKEVKS